MPPGFNTLRKDRVDGYGGVLLAVSREFTDNQITTDTDKEIIATKISTGCKKTSLVIVSVYRPPNTDIDYALDLCSKIKHLVNTNRSATIWISGDLNLPDIDWKTESIEGHQTSNAINTAFLSAFQELGLAQIVDWQQYKTFKKQMQFDCRKTHQKYVDDMICGDMANNPNKLWSYIKSKRCDNTGIASLLSDGKPHSDNISKTRLLNEQFSSVFTRANTSSLPNLGPSPYPDIQRFDVTEEGVLKLLNNLNHHKASGPDNIPTRLLKEEATELSPIFTLLLNSSGTNSDTMETGTRCTSTQKEQ